MLKYKRITFASIVDTKEDVRTILAGMSGKNRRIVSISATPDDTFYIRVYRDAEQIVDVNSYALTVEAPFLAMDLPLAEGQVCTAGFLNSTGGTVTDRDITIGYTEAD